MFLTFLSKRYFVALFSLIFIFTSSLPAGAAPYAGALVAVKVQYGAAWLKPGEVIELEVLLTIKVPEIKPSSKRQPVAVSLVLDRSGSMDEARKLDYAKKAAKILLTSLEKDDLFALTMYDSTVNVLYPLGKVSAKDKEKLLKTIDNINSGGMTFLSGGLEEGIKQLQKIKKEGPARVILLSDGLANAGVIDVEQIAAIGAKARQQGIGVSTIGLGVDFDEDIMQHLAQRGGGQYYYIADSEYLPSVFKDELALVVNSFTKDLATAYVPVAGVSEVKVYGYTTAKEKNDTRIEMSDFSSGEERQIMLRLKVKPGAKAGRQELGTLNLHYKSPDDGKARAVSIPLALEITGDKAEQARLDQERAVSVKEVHDEALLRQADEAHILAMQDLEQGKVDSAKKRLQEQQEALAVASVDNVAIANKRERLRIDEENLERAAKNESLQKSMTKGSKSSAYQNAQGNKKGDMLQAGDSGFMVEKLQNALKAQGYYKGAVDGVYGAEVTAAVTAFQKGRSLRADGIAGPATMQALGI